MSVKPALYAVNVSPLVTDDALFRKALALASPTRKEKAARYRRREDAALSLGAELLLRYAFSKAGEPFPTAFFTSPDGKPFTPDSPLCFNLSHAGEWAVCAVANGEVGCDVEKIDPAHADVAKRCFTAAENAQLDEAKTEAERVCRFFRMWTLKESFQKAVGQGLKLPLSSFSVTLGEPSRIDTMPDAVLCEYADLAGYACAFCTLSEEEPPPLSVVFIEELLQNEVEK